eukprot:5695301-Prymnesium_polylepis.1
MERLSAACAPSARRRRPWAARWPAEDGPRADVRPGRSGGARGAQWRDEGRARRAGRRATRRRD